MANKSTVVRVIKKTAPILSMVAPPLAARWMERLFITPMPVPAPEREQPFKRSAKVTSLPFDKDRSIRLYTWGEPSPTVVLVHGWSGRGTQLGFFIQPLIDAGYRVVAFDQLGHGGSDGKLSTLLEFAQSLELVAQYLGPIEAIISHSLGAASTTLALSRGLSPKRAIHVASPDTGRYYLERLGGYAGFSEDVTAKAEARLVGRLGLTFEDAQGTRLAPQISLPVLIVHDKGDKDVPFETALALAEAFPKGRLMSTEGLGHTRLLRDPEVVAEVVAFIEEGKGDGEDVAKGERMKIAG